MKSLLIAVAAALLVVGCVKPPDELEPNFWDPTTEVAQLGQVLDTSYVLNNTNERVYTVEYKVFWDQIPLLRDDAIISVVTYNNGYEIPMPYNTANRARYSALFFAPPQKTSCITFGFITSTGGYTRQFDLMCVDVP